MTWQQILTWLLQFAAAQPWAQTNLQALILWIMTYISAHGMPASESQLESICHQCRAHHGLKA